jgi:putative membrane protein
MPSKTEWTILFVNVLYLVLFAFHFFSRGNFEFVWYIFIMFILIGVFSFLHKKYNFSTLTLWGLTLWGFAHMLGGSTLLGEPRIYGRVLIDLFTTGDTTVFRYDHLLHFYFYVVMTSVIYQIAKGYFRPGANWKVVALLIVFAIMGVGAFNEIIEFLPVLFLAETGVGGYLNVAWDIVFNTLGALVAIVYISLKRK